ncbi:MAG: cell division protein ZapA [Nitrospirota bacterium]|nr:cell division protein ZapA [Nitrospirota bacterium]
MSHTARPGIKVAIFGQDYMVRGDADAAYVTSLAAYVDGKMREVASKVSDASASRVAVMAALNICDEMFKMKKQQAKLAAVTDDLFKTLEE